MRRLLSHTKKNILKDTCFTISNIAAGNQNQISAIIDAKIVPALVLLFTTSSELDIKAEVTWALANALSNGTDVHITYLIDQGCVQCLCQLLEHYDIITIEAILEALENILTVGEMLIKASIRRTNIYVPHLKEVAKDPLLRLQIADSSVQSKIQNILSFLND